MSPATLVTESAVTTKGANLLPRTSLTLIITCAESKLIAGFDAKVIATGT